ncbi:uncharacterized protein LOC120348107 [Styela clava]|uniref:uncharacterized protein LOC120348107 n=1 Tax=Styela clava TaxID=7725 RepID=UPI00193AAAE5|nr:uncharacterized protein LOC120348107 [Styela clava]
MTSYLSYLTIIAFVVVLSIFPEIVRCLPAPFAQPQDSRQILEKPSSQEYCGNHKSWVVNIEHISQSDKKCKGIRVSDDLIITVAHCFVTSANVHARASNPTECFQPSDYRVTDHSGNEQQGSLVQHSKNYHFVPRNLQYRHDIAVIKVNSQVSSQSCWRDDAKPGPDDVCWIYLMRGQDMEYKKVNTKSCHELYGYEEYKHHDSPNLQCTKEGDADGVVPSDSGSVIVCADSDGKHYVKGLLSMKHKKKEYALLMAVHRGTHRDIQNQRANDCKTWRI